MVRRLVVALGLLAGCPAPVESVPVVRRGSCDDRLLAERAAALREVSTRWTPASGTAPDYTKAAAAAIWQACPELPGVLKVVVDDSMDHRSREEVPELPGHAVVHASLMPFQDERPALNRTVCAGWDSVAERYAMASATQRAGVMYDGCELGRIGLLGREEVIPEGPRDLLGLFALDRWLRAEGGAAPDDARTLVRGLNASRLKQRPRPGQLLAYAARGEPLPIEEAELVFVGPGEVRHDHVAAPLVAGAIAQDAFKQILAALASAQRDPEDEDAKIVMPSRVPPVLVMVDRRVRWPTFVRVIEAMRGSGIEAIDVAFVTAEPPLHLGVVRVGSTTHDRHPVVGIRLGAWGAEVRCEGEVTRVDDERIFPTLARCRWLRSERVAFKAEVGVGLARVEKVQRLHDELPFPELFGRAGEMPARDPSRIEVMVRAGELEVRCHDEAHVVADVEAMRLDMMRCSGPDSEWLDVRADPGISLQRGLEVIVAGHFAGKRMAVRSD